MITITIKKTEPFEVPVNEGKTRPDTREVEIYSQRISDDKSFDLEAVIAAVNIGLQKKQTVEIKK